MQRQRGELVPIGEVVSGLDDVLVPAIREASPQARHHFTQADQVNQLVAASEADPDLGFMARLLALCSLPRTNPGNRLQYKRVNGPYKLILIAGGDNRLPYGNLPRLILAWVCTEAVRTQSRELVLGRSFSGFMRKLGMQDDSGSPRGDRTRLRNQMKRLFNASVQLIYEDAQVDASASSFVADRTVFWWNERKPDEQVLFNSKIRLGEAVLRRDHPQPRTARHEHPHGTQTMFLGPRYLPLACLPHLRAPCSAISHLAASVPSVRRTPGKRPQQENHPKLPGPGAPRAEEDQAGLAGVELHYGSGRLDPLTFNPDHRTSQSRLARKLIPLFRAKEHPLKRPANRGRLPSCPFTTEDRSWGVLSDCYSDIYPQVPVILDSFPR